MDITFYILSGVLIILHLFPLINDQHWIFRVSDFGRIQIFVLQIIVFVLGYILVDERSNSFWVSEGILALLILHNAWILYPYFPLNRVGKYEDVDHNCTDVIILSANVYQFNTEYDRLISLVKEINPHIILTMETNRDWEDALAVLVKDYPYSKMIPLENCYGMHFFSKLKVDDIKSHFFMSDDLPSIEASLYTEDGYKFTFFGVHPPPPSPTEEETSKERDGDLMAIAKRINGLEQPVIAIGDFNTVAWSRASKLFRKTSGLIDPRRGRGFVSTFHVKYPLFRFPLDLLFHSKEIIIKDLEAKEDIGSDHFPLYCRFYINLNNKIPENKKSEMASEEKGEVERMIEVGKKEEGNRVSNETR